MPAILDRCVKDVMAKGKDKSSAYAICTTSTGYVRAAGGKWKKSIKKKTVAKQR